MKGRYVPGVGWISQADYYILIAFKIFACSFTVLAGCGALVLSIYIWIYIRNVLTISSGLFSLGILGCLGLSCSVIHLVACFWEDCYNEIVRNMRRK